MGYAKLSLIASCLCLAAVPASGQDFIASGVSSPMTLVQLGGYRAERQVGLQILSDVRIGDRFGLLVDHPVGDRWSISMGAMLGKHLAFATDSTNVERSGTYAAFGASVWRSLRRVGPVELSAGGGLNADVFPAVDAGRFSIPVAVTAAARIPLGPVTLVPATTIGVAARFDDLQATRAFANSEATTGASHFGWLLSIAPRVEVGRVWLEASMDRSMHLASDSMGEAPVYYETTPRPTIITGDDPKHVMHAGYSLGMSVGVTF